MEFFLNEHISEYINLNPLYSNLNTSTVYTLQYIPRQSTMSYSSCVTLSHCPVWRLEAFKSTIQSPVDGIPEHTQRQDFKAFHLLSKPHQGKIYKNV